jgi:hypothetical protein
MGRSWCERRPRLLTKVCGTDAGTVAVALQTSWQNAMYRIADRLQVPTAKSER